MSKLLSECPQKDPEIRKIIEPLIHGILTCNKNEKHSLLKKCEYRCIKTIEGGISWDYNF